MLESNRLLAALPPTDLARYVGVYASSEEPWNLLPIEDGKLGEILFHDATDDTLFALTPAGDGRFFRDWCHRKCGDLHL